MHSEAAARRQTHGSGPGEGDSGQVFPQVKAGVAWRRWSPAQAMGEVRPRATTCLVGKLPKAARQEPTNRGRSRRPSVRGVENLLPANLTSTDTTVRDAGICCSFTRVPARRIAGRAGYWSRPAPLLEPAHDHDPAALAQRLRGMLGLVLLDDTVKNDASCRETARGQAVEPTKSARSGSGCRVGSARVPGWLGGVLAAGVGHASTVRPDPSTLGVVGARGSHHEGARRPVPGDQTDQESRSAGPEPRLA
jgi:hypothetical protein